MMEETRRRVDMCVVALPLTVMARACDGVRSPVYVTHQTLQMKAVRTTKRSDAGVPKCARGGGMCVHVPGGGVGGTPNAG